MKKRFIAIALCAVMLLALAACGSGGESLTFGTGGDSGTYYAYGGTLAGYVTEHTDTSVTAVASNGSQTNIEDIASGAIQLGFVQSDVMSYAYQGTRLFEEPVTNFSTVAALYMEQVQIVTLDPEIKTVGDLAGKTVSIGAVGSGVYFNAIDVLGAYDLTEDDISPVYQNFDDSVESLQDGRIDAAFIVAGAPTTSIVQLATTQEVHLVSLDQEHIDKLIEVSPYYSAYTIGADVYGTAEDCTTVAISAVLIGRADLDPDVAYTIVYTLFQNADKISHAKAAELNLEFGASVTDVPYNEGAARYFEEQGFTVPTA